VATLAILLRRVHLSRDSATTAVSPGMKVRLVPSLALLLLSSVIHVAEWVIFRQNAPVYESKAEAVKSVTRVAVLGISRGSAPMEAALVVLKQEDLRLVRLLQAVV